jgi:carboxylesterase
VRPLGEALHRKHGVTVLGPLLAGHGTSLAALEACHFQDWEGTAVAALAELRQRCDRIAIAGLSMGGLLALRLARASDPDLRALVLMGVPLWFSRPRVLAIRLMDRVGLRLRIPKIAGSDVGDEAARRASPAYDRLPIRGVAELLDLMETVRADLGAIRLPALILHGSLDHTAAPACARALAKKLGGEDVRLRMMERSWHLIPIDVEREKVADEVGEFLLEKLT